jgi:hypothetical protein
MSSHRGEYLRGDSSDRVALETALVRSRGGNRRKMPDLQIFPVGIEMPRNISVVLYIVVLIAVVITVDVLFFKNRFWERLIVNIGVVLVFAAFYLRFLKKP